MNFNSVDYCLFFIIVLGIYYIIPNKIRYIWLVAASYYFYICYNVTYLYIIFSVTIISYFAALIIDKLNSYGGTGGNRRIIKTVLFISICLCFGFLLFYKYSNFIISNINFVLNIFSIGNKITAIKNKRKRQKGFKTLLKASFSLKQATSSARHTHPNTLLRQG